MAFDLIENRSAGPTVPLNRRSHHRERAVSRNGATKASTKWRQSVLGIVQESLDQLDLAELRDNDHIWRREAQQRALNFAVLGLSTLHTLPAPHPKRNREPWDVAAVAVLGGAYRLLAKCEGAEPIQCRNLLNTLLTNMTLAYGPVCGAFDLNLRLCSLIMAPVECRALILSVGLLIRAAMKHSLCSKMGGALEATLATTTDGTYALTLRLKGQRFDFSESQEIDLASRLGGIFKSELSYCATDIDCVDLLLTFPASQDQNHF